MLEQVGEDLEGERGGGGADLGVYEYDTEERFVDVGSDFGGLGRRWPGGRGDAGADDGAESFDGGAGVGLEEAGIDLTENVADRFAFFGKLYREGVLKLGGQIRNNVCSKSVEIGQCQEHANVLYLLGNARNC